MGELGGHRTLEHIVPQTFSLEDILPIPLYTLLISVFQLLDEQFQLFLLLFNHRTLSNLNLLQTSIIHACTYVVLAILHVQGYHVIHSDM